MDILKDRIHIKHLVAFKPLAKHGTVFIAILTDSNEYFECSIEFRKLVLSKWILKRIRSIFQPYYIDKRTDITVNERLDEDHPLYQYFMALRQHIGFRMNAVTIDKIVSRVHYYYYGKPASKTRFNAVWKRTLEDGICPWISKQVEYALQNKGSTVAQRIRHIRLGMFYVIVKNYYYRDIQERKKRKARSVD